MADINTNVVPAAAGPADRQGGSGDERPIIELIELLFFAYRDFTCEPDGILKDYGFGRAHHRVVHFVGRNPGIRVAELLSILAITKQSLGRVLRELVETGYVAQREGPSDRRQRLLYLTDAGSRLHQRLMAPQIRRVKGALERAGARQDGEYRAVLVGLVDAANRAEVARLIAGHGGEEGEAL